MTPIVAALLVLMSGSATGRAPGQPCQKNPSDMSLDEFIACARAGTEKYRDHQAAVRDGYRLVGRDFPGMGEHWIRVSLLFDGKFEASRPEVLNYVLVDGKRALLGVGYAIPLLRGEKAPDGPAGPSAWHDHSRTIEDETVLPHHHAQGGAADDARLAMLHVWIWAPNPAGMFAADNWEIPLLRLKLPPVAEPLPAVGKALALIGGGRDYFELAIAAAGMLSEEERVRVAAAFNRAEQAVQAIIRRAAGPALGKQERADLVNVWTLLWRDIDATLSDDARRKLAHLPIR